MSRIGKKPIELPGSVKVAISGREVTIENGGNKLTMTHRPEVTVTHDADNKSLVVASKNDSRTAKAMWGLTRALLNNMVQGVTQGYTKELEIIGVGWTAKVQGMTVQLKVGYADMRVVDIPAGVKVEVQGNRIKISGADKQQVGQLAAQIRAHRKPEPYNGKGIKYVDEVISRKQGKAFAGGK